MRKKPSKLNPYPRSPNTSFSMLLDSIDPERASQRQEFLTRQKDNDKTSSKKPKKCHQPTRKTNRKIKVNNFEKKLEITNQWLQRTFPDLFDPSHPKPLDIHIVRDIKAYYKNGRIAKKYPDGLVIKAALSRYMESPEYLNCLVDGASRYNMEGGVSGLV